MADTDTPPAPEITPPAAPPENSKPVRLTPVQSARLVGWISDNKARIEREQLSGPVVAEQAAAALNLAITANHVRKIAEELGVRVGAPRERTDTTAIGAVLDSISAKIDTVMNHVRKLVDDVYQHQIEMTRMLTDIRGRVEQAEGNARLVRERLDTVEWVNGKAGKPKTAASK